MTRIAEFVNADLRFPATDSGPLDGPPVPLLHGWPLDRESWTAVPGDELTHREDQA